MAGSSNKDKAAELKAVKSASTIDPDPPFDARANSLRIFDKSFWLLETVLHWISFRSKETLIERLDQSVVDTYRRRRWYGPPFASKRSGEELLDALQSGKLPAVLNGKHLPALTWSHVEIHPGDAAGSSFRGEFPEDVMAERKIILTLWPAGDKEAPKNQKPRKGRIPSYDWDGARSEFFRLMKHHGPFLIGDDEWNGQARAEDAISDWFTEQGLHPAESIIRTHFKSWLEEYASANEGR